MTANEIRQSFLRFFEDRGHRIVPSAPVIPWEDPTLLFTNAGMNQFKDVFLGTGKREYSRAADTQKCIRVSGKHNDLEEVGRDTYHHTFFEMLGNWSFGDYYKKEAIRWAWELLTDVWKLPKHRLWATIFETDDEAEECWKSETDIDHSHILRFGAKDNFWEMGETGPCGPCSEIHIDMTEGGNARAEHVNAGTGDLIEIWNLVFIQYDRDDAEKLNPLPAKHVDTGMGFERVVSVLQGKNSNYDTDLFRPIIGEIENLVEAKHASPPVYGRDERTDVAIRVIADHIRALTFAIADGAVPSNEGRGYVLRRILRRAARFGRNLGMLEPFMHKLVSTVVKTMGDIFPDIVEKQLHIEKVIHAEEEGFSTTLDRGLSEFNSILVNTILLNLIRSTKKDVGYQFKDKTAKFFSAHNEIILQVNIQENIERQLGKKLTISGQDAFRLYDTYGFPLDLTQLMAEERGLNVDVTEFSRLMEEQKERSRKSKGYGRTAFLAADLSFPATKFVGYENFEARTQSWSLSRYEDNSLKEVVLYQTPFYAESGGQVGDTGVLKWGSSNLRVLDTQWSGNQILHILERATGINPQGDELLAIVDKRRRLAIMKNHTATHLVHEALRRVLGSHVQQQGSLVAPDKLRFDFPHFGKITAEELRAIEQMVNEKIQEGIEIYTETLPIERARKIPNVKMFFGDKYGEVVRVVFADERFSVEFCGGTHVKNSKEIGLFKVISESSIASGVRRIEAVTGEGISRYIEDRFHKIDLLDEQLMRLVDEQESLEKELSKFKKVKAPSRPTLGVISLDTKRARHDEFRSTEEALDNVEKALQQREESFERISAQTQRLKKELSKYRVQEVGSQIDSLVGSASTVNGFKVVSGRIDAGNMEELKTLADRLRTRLVSGVGVLGAVVENKAAFVCVVTDDLIEKKKLQAGKIVGELAKQVGGGGGGRAHLAAAGGKYVQNLDAALENTVSVVKSFLKG